MGNQIEKQLSSPLGTGTSPVSVDRRHRGRLRELCDEVLASFRIATNRELVSDGEWAENRALLADMAIVPLK